MKEADLEPSTPPDPRAWLPIKQRPGVTETRLRNGTLLTSYDDAPLSPLLEANPEPLSEDGLAWSNDKPRPPKKPRGPDRWERLR